MFYFCILCVLCSHVNGFIIDGLSSPLDCSMTAIDVVFLLDSSASEGSTNFNIQLNFVKSFVDIFDIGPSTSDMQVSVVTFSSTVMEHFNLKRFHSKDELLRAISRIPYFEGTTHTDKAITFAVQHSFTPEAGDRTYAPNVMIVMTDGQSVSPSQTRYAADLAHHAGIKCFAIGIGSGVAFNEIQTIASDPQNVFRVSIFGVLSLIKNDLATKTCEAVGTKSTVISTSTQPATTTQSMTTPRKIMITVPDCVDSIPNCSDYAGDVCTQYRQWAEKNCPRFCNFCTEQTTTTTSTTTTVTGPVCPNCDQNMHCVWNRVCYPEEVCMIRQFQTNAVTIHCSKKPDCLFMKTFVKSAEIVCCQDEQCSRFYLGIQPHK